MEQLATLHAVRALRVPLAAALEPAAAAARGSLQRVGIEGQIGTDAALLELLHVKPLHATSKNVGIAALQCTADAREAVSKERACCQLISSRRELGEQLARS